MKKIAIFFLSFIFLMGCLNDDKRQNISEKEYLKKGGQITAAVFSKLSAELQTAMENGGIEHALQYCNLNALNIVDSLSQEHGVKIRRTSDKFRNPVDRPDKYESAMLDWYEKAIKEEKEIMPKVVLENDGHHHFYAPIYVNDLCLKCHGKIGEELSQENADLIKKYYPNDLATGYSKGDFRGIWNVEFNINDDDKKKK